MPILVLEDIRLFPNEEKPTLSQQSAADAHERAATEKKEAGKLSSKHELLLKAIWLDEKSPFGIPAKNAPGLLSSDAAAQHERLQAELKQRQQSGPPAPPVAHGVTGGGQWNANGHSPPPLPALPEGD